MHEAKIKDEATCSRPRPRPGSKVEL